MWAEKGQKTPFSSCKLFFLIFYETLLLHRLLRRKLTPPLHHLPSLSQIYHIVGFSFSLFITLHFQVIQVLPPFPDSLTTTVDRAIPLLEFLITNT